MNIHSFYERLDAMTKSENKPHDRTIEIINASIEAFAEHGYHNTTIQDIVNKAKFNSVGTIFRYFPRTKNSVKDDILKAIFEEKITLLTESVRQKTSLETTPLGKIKAFLDHHFEHLKNEEELAKVLQVELRQSHHFLQDYDHKKLQDYLKILDEAIEQGQQEGVLKSSIPPKVVRWAIFGAIDEISTTWVLTQRAWPENLEDISSYIMTMFFDGLKV